jgi:hypothetical protein
MNGLHHTTKPRLSDIYMGVHILVNRLQLSILGSRLLQRHLVFEACYCPLVYPINCRHKQGFNLTGCTIIAKSKIEVIGIYKIYIYMYEPQYTN